MSATAPAAAAAAAPAEVTIASPFDDFTYAFDASDDASYSDVGVVLPGRAEPLRLHRALLARASRTLRAALRAPPTAPAHYDAATRTLVGCFAGADAAEGAAAVAWLRFCYGAPVRATAAAAPAVLAVLLRLDLAHAAVGAVQARLEALMVAAAAADVRVGAQLLRDAAARAECHRAGVCRVDRALARVVLARANVCAHSALVVDETLLALPPAYLDCAEYGAPHSTLGEHAVRQRYAAAHPELDPAARRAVLRARDLAQLSSDEMDTLAREWDGDSEGMLGVYRDAFAACQKRIAALSTRCECSRGRALCRCVADLLLLLCLHRSGDDRGAAGRRRHEGGAERKQMDRNDAEDDSIGAG